MKHDAKRIKKSLQESDLPYSTLARYYDLIVGDSSESYRILARLLKEQSPRAKRILELACGTGSVLKYLSPRYELCGVDINNEMLALARQKLPISIPLYQQDMTCCDIGQTFDGVLCVFDSINHLQTKTKWQQTFQAAARHLNPGGVFIFDVNTIAKLKNLDRESPFVFDVDGHTLIMNIHSRNGSTADWHLQFFERRQDGLFRMLEERIPERAFPISLIRTMLQPYFSNVQTYDFSQQKVTARSERVYFVCTKR